VLLGAWSMSFLALLFSLGIVRGGPSGWPPPALADIPASLRSASVLVAVASSAALAWGLRARRMPAVVIGGALAVVFVIAQVGLLRAFAGAGFELREPPDAMVIALAGFHAVHAVLGAAGLAWVAGRAWSRTDCGYGPLRRWAMFWHFVSATWLAIYLAVFVA
jgi:heme/copper-type cytochrome/quinol oxidase subunit 3